MHIAGLLSTWLKHHPSLLQGVLPMILGGLSQPNLAPSAALAFRDVCVECASQLSGVADQLIPHCQVGGCGYGCGYFSVGYHWLWKWVRLEVGLYH